MKACIVCNVVKPLTEFFADRQNSDGRRRSCKTCRGAYCRKRRAEKLEQIREVERRYSYRKARDKEAQKRLRESRDPIKKKAQYTLRNAVAAGLVDKPQVCESCGKTMRLHGHHDDYSKPLDVRWLCHLCHMAVHRQHALARRGGEPGTPLAPKKN